MKNYFILLITLLFTSQHFVGGQRISLQKERNPEFLNIENYDSGFPTSTRSFTKVKSIAEILGKDVPASTKFVSTRARGDSCITPGRNRGVCSHISEERCAPILNYIRANGITQLLVNYLNLAIRRPCGFEGSDFTLCCAGRTTSTTTTTSPTTSTTTTTTTTSITTTTIAPTTTTTSTGGNLNDCGITKFETRIVGGTEARPGAWPWAVILGSFAGPGKFNVICGGSLIDSSHVLTAAHCFPGGTNNAITTIRLGEHDVSTNNDGVTPINVGVEAVKVHEHYDPKSVENDIAIVRMKRPVQQFTDYIRPVCLPREFVGQNLNRILHSDPTIVGWGATSFNGDTVNALRQASVPLVGRRTCRRAYRSIENIRITRNKVCAGNGDKDTCIGDSGGPMLTRQTGHWSVIGITSFGVECARPDFPGVYTRVDKYLDWIDRMTRNTF